MHWWFQTSLNSFLSCDKNINFLVSSMKLLTNSENAYWNLTQNSLIDVLQRLTLIICSKMRQKFCCLRRLSLWLQDHRRLPVCIFRVKIAAVGSLIRVTERNFEISQYFLRRQAVENFENHQRIFRNINTFKGLFISWPYVHKTRTFFSCLLWNIFSLYLGYDSYAAPIGANAAWGADKAAPASASGQGWALFYNTLIDVHRLHNNITTNCLLAYVGHFENCIQSTYAILPG